MSHLTTKQKAAKAAALQREQKLHEKVLDATERAEALRQENAAHAIPRLGANLRAVLLSHTQAKVPGPVPGAPQSGLRREGKREFVPVFHRAWGGLAGPVPKRVQGTLDGFSGHAPARLLQG